MDKILPNINKDDDIGKGDNVPIVPTGASAVPEISSLKTTVSAYNPELSQKNWEESQNNLRWDSTPQGRAVIRLFSRGGLGAAAFAAGNWYVSRGKGMAGYHTNIKFSEIEASKPLQYVAKAIDTVFGKPIKATVKTISGNEEFAERFVRFRPTNGVEAKTKGRSLGHESVNVTFDFFCSSVGDAMGRDIANLLDHNVKHDWKDDKGHIKYPEAVKSLAKTAWRYVSYNGGEDWAVAVPYAYYMGVQRKIINHFSPGFQLDAERGLNGGSFKIDRQGKITGNYNWEGLLDLQGRFTAYNVGTLMYREAYNHIDNKIHGKNTALYGFAEDKKGKKQGILQDIGDLFKWGARSVVKGVVYMTPAVPFFSIFRTTQSKHRGIFINSETESALGFDAGNGKYDILHANELRRPDSKFKYGADGKLPIVTLSAVNKDGTGFEIVEKSVINHPFSEGDLKVFEQGEGNTLLNGIGKLQNSVRSTVNRIPTEKFGWQHPSRRSMDTYVNAAFSYTPYMYAKGEAARLWDSGRMDAAAERMIDGAAKFDFREFKAGAQEVWRTIRDKPFADKKREEYALKRIREDESPADNLTREQANIDKMQDIHRSQLSWQQRIIHGRPAEKISDEPKAEKHSSYLEQEAMRKALSELQPPTNSIH